MTEQHSTAYDSLTAAELMARLDSGADGLSTAVAAERLREMGPNLLRRERQRSPWQMLFEQYRDPMIVLLLVASGISGVVGEINDAVVILIIVALNSLVGFFQDYRAEKALAALKQLAAPFALVRRDGHVRRIPAADLVPGDLVLVESGSIVPADLRLIEVHALQVDEAALTGESAPVAKTAEPVLTPGQVPGERHNMLFSGTRISYGRGSGLVTATGMATEMGAIAHLLDTTETLKTPLQLRLARVGKNLAWAALVICALVFAVGVLRGEDWLLMFLTAVSLAVAAVPEALPAVVTISLALGARRLVRVNSLIRRLPAVETLGSTTVICSDKTGTLTQNRMTVEQLYDAQLQAVDGDLPQDDPLLLVAGLCHDVELDEKGEAVGDPTEIALYLKAVALNAEPHQLIREYPRVGEIPFSSERQLMSTLHRTPAGDSVLLCKGSFEAVSARCRPFDRDPARQRLEAMADSGLRVLALAWRRLAQAPAELKSEIHEKDLDFLGLCGSFDPPRDESAEAVKQCRAAGIVPVMITGDHPLTALRMAQRIGLVDAPDAQVVTGAELAALSPEELRDLVARVRVYARVAPEQKLRIVMALQRRGEVVAMTGDGVNDAPALKRAEIGIAMGLNGTDVAREAAEMVLLDDNFATIVAAVREGRVMYDNLRKFFRYILTSNIGELATIFLAPLVGLPMPLLPLHLLWINLVTDGAPALALATEGGDEKIMQRPPVAPAEGLFARGLGGRMLGYGLLLALVCLLTEKIAVSLGWPWQTMVFTVLCLAQLFYALTVRSEGLSLVRLGFWSNPFLALTVLLSLAVQLGIIYVPALQSIFHTQALSLVELTFCLLMALVPAFAVELEKLLLRGR